MILVTLIINIIIFYYLDTIARFVNTYDVPDKKLKIHKRKTPLLGGIILMINYLLYFLSQEFSKNNFFINHFELENLLGMLFLIIGFFILGFYDDKIKLSPNKKFLFSILIVLMALYLNNDLVINKVSISFYENKIFFENFSTLFTLFCILILTNSLNFYDGINGQSCIFFIIIFLYLYITNNYNEFYLFNIIVLIFLLALNLTDKIFLGDCGVFLLSSIVSISLIYEHNVNKNIFFADEIFLLLILPGFDLVRLTFTRILNKKNAFFGDRNHIHHLLVKRFSLLNSNLILIILSICPIFMFSVLKINFYLSFFSFTFLYLILITFLKPDDKKYNYR